jgi:hypothetical protein
LDFGTAGGFFARAKCSSLRTAVISVSITEAILSRDGTAIALLPFSNSIFD